ncbi:MAG: hypothetical protein Q8K36_02385, partial [Alphaproteobacteria bacterium]|nr:hypothetical protein [Alphaproteobacteria bacterium]
TTEPVSGTKSPGYELFKIHELSNIIASYLPPEEGDALGMLTKKACLLNLLYIGNEVKELFSTDIPHPKVTYMTSSRLLKAGGIKKDEGNGVQSYNRSGLDSSKFGLDRAIENLQRLTSNLATQIVTEPATYVDPYDHEWIVILRSKMLPKIDEILEIPRPVHAFLARVFGVALDILIVDNVQFKSTTWFSDWRKKILYRFHRYVDGLKLRIFCKYKSMEYSSMDLLISIFKMQRDFDQYGFTLGDDCYEPRGKEVNEYYEDAIKRLLKKETRLYDPSQLEHFGHAVERLKVLAHRGFDPAQDMLAIGYATGQFGLPHDVEQLKPLESLGWESAIMILQQGYSYGRYGIEKSALDVARMGLCPLEYPSRYLDFAVSLYLMEMDHHMRLHESLKSSRMISTRSEHDEPVTADKATEGSSE